MDSEDSKKVPNDIQTPPGAADALETSIWQLSPCVINLKWILDLSEDFENGYDSDGEIGPFFDCIQYEGEQIFDEEVLPSETPLEPAQPPSISPVSPRQSPRSPEKSPAAAAEQQQQQ